MKLNSKRILVTGAGGFVGSHLIEKLLKISGDVTAFVRYNSRNDYGMLDRLPRGITDKIEVISGDLRDSDAVRDAVKGKDVIFHLASLIAIPYSYKHPREVVETNVIGTLNILMAAKEYRTAKIIHTSTSEVYGTAQYIPMDEQHPLQGQSPYSASKIAADKIAESFHLSFRLPVATIRPFNAYGPRQSARSVIPTVITQALSGDKIYLGSLSPRRDFTYVDDVLDGFIKIAELDEAVGRVINIGSNFDISVKELVEKISSIIGKKLIIKIDKKRTRPENSEVMRLRADNLLAKRLLGWKPIISLDKGLKLTIDWMSENLNLYKRGYTI